VSQSTTIDFFLWTIYQSLSQFENLKAS